VQCAGLAQMLHHDIFNEGTIVEMDDLELSAAGVDHG
jgi:hypothetical protein